jgi:hypothetical protein
MPLAFLLLVMPDFIAKFIGKKKLPMVLQTEITRQKK